MEQKTSHNELSHPDSEIRNPVFPKYRNPVFFPNQKSRNISKKFDIKISIKFRSATTFEHFREDWELAATCRLSCALQVPLPAVSGVDTPCLPPPSLPSERASKLHLLCCGRPPFAEKHCLLAQASIAATVSLGSGLAALLSPFGVYPLPSTQPKRRRER